MKKIHSLLLAIAAAGTLSTSAQQLPNPGFENWKESCGDSESFGTTTGMRQRPGVEPSDWFGSSVNQKVGVEKKETLVFKTTGKSGNGVQLTNKYVGVSLGFTKIGSTAPGYISLGTPWVYAVTTVSKCDGGTYGGADFTFRPDAISGEFKRTDSNDEVSHVIFYSWEGTFKSKVGENGNPTTAVREDVDRAILGRDNAYLTDESNGTLIGKVDYTFKSTNSDWQSIEIPIEYNNDKTPQKYNVVICAGDYWTRSNMKEETDLHVDDVKLIYYSRLASLTINGTSVEGFNSNTYSYTVDSEMPAESAFAFTCMGNSGSGNATLSLDKANAVATITVTNSNTGGEDTDGQTSHVYTINFNKSEVVIGNDLYGIYGGVITIKAIEAGLADVDIERPGNVHIIDNGKNDGTCDFKLPDFSLGDTEEAYIGDIVVKNMSVTNSSDGGYLISGSVNPLKLTMSGSEIVAKVEVSGTIDADGKIVLDIAVVWIMDPENDPEGTESGFPIPVKFNGQKETSAVSGIEIDNENAPVELYNLNGVRVNTENAAPGIYIRRQGTEVSKIVVR